MFVTKVLFVCQNSIESFRSQENKIGMDDKQNSDYRKKMCSYGKSFIEENRLL